MFPGRCRDGVGVVIYPNAIDAARPKKTRNTIYPLGISKGDAGGAATGSGFGGAVKGAAAAPFFFFDALPDGDDAASPFFFLGGRLRFAGAGPLTAAFCPALGLTMASWAAW